MIILIININCYINNVICIAHLMQRLQLEVLHMQMSSQNTQTQQNINKNR